MTLLHPRGFLLVTGSCFLVLAAAAVVLGAFPADTALRDFVLGLASPPTLALMRVVNYAGAWQLLLPGTLALLVVFPGARRRWWLWIGLMLAAPASEGLAKALVGRPRPEDVSWGFPSGHATAAAAFFGAMIYLAGSLPPMACRLVRGLSLAGMLLVAVARVMLRAHWPSDALAGLALGLSLATAAVLIDIGGRERRPPRTPPADTPHR